MSSYKLGKQAVASKEQSRVRLWTRVSFITAVLLIPVVAYIVVTTLPPSPVTGKTIDKGMFDPYTVVKTKWFSFRVEKTWQAVPELTKEDKVYVYREMQGANPQGLLSIYINTRPIGVEDYYTRVQPVVIDDNNTLKPGEIQPDCTKLNTNKLVQVSFPITQDGVSFYCWAGSSLYYAIAGVRGGDTNIRLKRADGTEATYVITYRNTAFLPNESSLSNVLKTFKAL